MKPTSHNTLLFLGILVAAALVWAGLYFFSEKEKEDQYDENYGVVQTISTKPSPADLVDTYYKKIQEASDRVASAETCAQAAERAQEMLTGAKVPKEFLDQHLELFLDVQKKKKEKQETCAQDMLEQFVALQDTVTSTPLL